MFKNSVKIARILGIDVEVDVSWLIVFMIFSYTLSTNYFPQVSPGLDELIYWSLGVGATLFLFASVLVHEFAHSLTAIREGYEIDKITLFIFGGVAQLKEEPRTSAEEFKITIVGPISSLLLAGVFWGIYSLLPANIPITEGVFFLANVNLTVGIINMLPAFPLDGGRILRSMLWLWKKDLVFATKISVRAGSILAFLLMGVGFLTLMTVSLMGLWYILLGWLLYQAGQNSYSHVTLKEQLSGIKVKDVMTEDVRVVSTDLTVNELIDEFYQYKVGAFPVMGAAELKGIVTMNQVKNIEREQWNNMKVRNIMTPLNEAVQVEPEAEAVEAMMKMAEDNIGRVLVVDRDNLVGILSNTDLNRLLQMKNLFGR